MQNRGNLPALQQSRDYTAMQEGKSAGLPAKQELFDKKRPLLAQRPWFD
jgi:hypothetical protein